MVFNYLNTKVENRNSKIAGAGIFAKDNIKKDEIIAAFGGFVFENYEYKKLSEKLRGMPMRISDNLLIGSLKESELDSADLINHSCNPNAGIKGQILLVAIRDIDKNEEITFDYAMEMFGEPKLTLKCNCGSINCRKNVTSEDWKIPKLQEKYKGYFSQSIQEKIDNLFKK